MTVPTELVIVQVVSSRLLPLKILIVMGPVKPPEAEAVPVNVAEPWPLHKETSGPAFTVGSGLT